MESVISADGVSGHLTWKISAVLDFDFVYSLFRPVKEKAGISASRCCETEIMQ